ncbi:MAG TPA: Fe2+-dependent dioxygenase [Woeseiaceae bacterium]|nr:Fe2+-dependent dioxygenase [Woeseiaceae bacterium]
MLLAIPDVLSPQDVRHFRQRLDEADFADGNITAGHQSRGVKHNQQLPEDSPVARELRSRLLDALDASLLFLSAALPARVFPPLFNRYGVGESFGNHVDNALRQVRGTTERVRTDLSATLFLSEPGEYDGGELVVEDTYGTQAVKLPAGHLILYPGTSVHRVMPVTRGTRVASFFWVQSLVREDAQRRILFDMDMAIVRLRKDVGDNAALVSLTNTYHNLLRRWSTP